MNGSPELAHETVPQSSEEPESNAQTSSLEFTAYAGPLPPPDVLERFEQIHPGAAKQIFEEFRLEAAHRRQNEQRIVRSITFKQSIGAFTASFIGLLGISGGLWLAHEGKALGGLSSVLGTLATLLAVFLYQSRAAETADNAEESQSRAKLQRRS